MLLHYMYSRIESVSSRAGDPCSSFYDVACGGWVASRNITRKIWRSEMTFFFYNRSFKNFMHMLFYGKVYCKGGLASYISLFEVGLPLQNFYASKFGNPGSKVKIMFLCLYLENLNLTINLNLKT